MSALLVAGCGGHDPAPRTAAPAPVSVTSRGAGRVVDARMTVKRLKDPVSNELFRPAAGSRFVQVDLEWRNAGPNPLPIEWARFTALDAKGGEHAEAFRQPERELYPGRADSPHLMSVGFELPDGSRPVEIRMGSAVQALPMKGRWVLSPGTGR